jgi:predicted ATPase
LAEEEAERRRIAEEKARAEEEKRQAEEAKRLGDEMVSIPTSKVYQIEKISS